MNGLGEATATRRPVGGWGPLTTTRPASVTRQAFPLARGARSERLSDAFTNNPG
jgi:hypothetical protein